jgi:hypothetical protein
MCVLSSCHESLPEASRRFCTVVRRDGARPVLRWLQREINGCDEILEFFSFSEGTA